MILSGAMMFRYLADQKGEPKLLNAANLIDDSVAQFLADGKHLPYDLGGSTGTGAITEGVMAAMAAK